MTLYAETSSVLAWLLQGPSGETVQEMLAAGEVIVTSELTLVECDRVLLRSVATGASTSTEAAELQRILGDVVATWNIQPLHAATIHRARQSFPDDRIRALDAIHLASAITARLSLGDVEILSLDGRIRENAVALDFGVMPA